MSAVLGWPRLHLRRTTSTNDHARELAIAGAPHGTLVTADEQTAGRGRQGRRWEAPAGGALLMSLVLRDRLAREGEEHKDCPAPLPLLAAVAVCDTIGDEARIKWPNDVVVERPDGRLAKLAGILVEGRPQEGWAVLGIGLNVAVRLEEMPEDLRDTVATLGQSASAIEPTLGHLLAALSSRLASPADTTLTAWRARDVLSGREVEWRSQSGRYRGRAEGVDRGGRLRVSLSGGSSVVLDAGEVHLRYP